MHAVECFIDLLLLGTESSEKSGYLFRFSGVIEWFSNNFRTGMYAAARHGASGLCIATNTCR